MADKHQCSFCKKSFTREKTLSVHLCEQKRRWINKDEKHVRMAFASWLHWCKKTGLYLNKKSLTYDDFMKSSVYITFVKFGLYVEDLHMSNYLAYIDFMIKHNYKVTDWFKNSTYEYFVKMNTRQETVEDAIQKTIKYMDKWSIENHEDWTLFFEKISSQQVLDLLRNGRISPWIFFISKKAQSLLMTMSDEQVMLLDQFIDIKWWTALLRRKPNDRQFVEQIVEEYGI